MTNDDTMIDLRRILVPLDFSENTPAVLEWAAHLAEEHGSQVVLLHAYHLPVEFQQLEGAYLPEDFWANVKAETEQSLARYAETLRARGLAVETVAREGYPATVIEEEAGRQQADLIVDSLAADLSAVIALQSAASPTSS